MKKLIKKLLKPIIKELFEEFLFEKVHKSVVYYDKPEGAEIQWNNFFESVINNSKLTQ
jgi:large-conductance mechanosensitive channel